MLTNQGESRQPRPKVLIVASADGYLEVFGETGLDCHIINRPKMSTPRGGELADDYIEVAIPRRFRRLFFPSYCRATGNVRAVRPDELAAGFLSQKVSDILSRIGEKSEGATE